MPSSPSGSPLPLRFPPCATEEQRGRQRAGSETLPPQRSIIPGILSARAGRAGAAPGTPGCGGMGTAGGSPCTGGGSGDSPPHPPSRGDPQDNDFNSPPGLLWSQSSAHDDARLGRARSRFSVGLFNSLYLFLYAFVMKKGGASLIHEFLPGSCGARECHCH